MADAWEQYRAFSFRGAVRLAAAMLAAGLAAPCAADSAAAVEPPPPAALASTPAAAVADGIDRDATLRAVAAYKIGDDRSALQALQQLVIHANSLGRNDWHNFRHDLADHMAALLTSPSATLAAKVFVCGQLAEIATEEQAAALAGALTMRDQPLVAAAALGALERIRGPAVDGRLLEALGAVEGDLRIGVVAALGTRRVLAATEPSIALLRGADQALAAAAAQALGEIGGEPAAAALRQALGRVKGRLRGEVADASLDCAGQLLAAGQNAPAAALYEVLCGPDEAGPVRMAAWRGMVRANPAKGVDEVCAALTSGDPALQSMAAQLVPEAQGERATERLAGCAAKVSPPVHALLLGALAARGDAAAHSAAEAGVSSQDPEVRLAAIKALGALGNAGSVKMLVSRATAGGTPAEREAARNSLARLRGPGVNEALIDLLGRDDSGQQLEVLRTLAGRNATAALPAVAKAAGAAHPEVRQEAWRALGRLVTPQEVPILLDLLVRNAIAKEPPEDMVTAAGAALERAGRPGLDAALRELDRADLPAARVSLIQVVSAGGDDSALPALRLALQSTDAAARDAAVRGLAAWPTPTPLDDLLKLARGSEDSAHRVLALRGAIRLAGKVQGRTPEQMAALLAELMELAAATADRKAVLAELGRSPTEEALRLARKYQADPELAAEAGVAVKRITSALAQARGDAAKSPTGNAVATGGPSQPADYSWRQTDGALALLNHGRVVWQFNYGPDQPKPYFHPVALLDGTVLTAPSPSDHPWHRALWFSWKMLNGVNYWEEARETGRAQGLTEVISLKESHNADGSARFDLELGYHPPASVPVLTEERVIQVTAPDDGGAYRIDWSGTFIAQETDVLLQGGTAGGGYAGLSVRVSQASSDWVLINSEGLRDLPTDSNPANKGGLGANTHGHRARWADFSLVDTATRQPAGIAILSHPSNPRHPPPWHNILSAGGRFGYFSPAVLWSEPFTLRAGQRFTLRYRIIVHPGRGDPEALEKEWRTFAAQE